MTDTQMKKVENLQAEIGKVEAKINKLMAHRAMLASQIKEIKEKVPKEPIRPTEEQRKAQSIKDKARHAERLQAYTRTYLKPLEFN